MSGENELKNHWAVRNPGLADQFRAEAVMARKELGLGDEKSDDVSPGEIRDAINVLKSATPPGTEVVPEGTMELLKSMEWSGHDRELDCRACPGCGWLRGDLGKYHHKDCELSTILTRHRAALSPVSLRGPSWEPQPRRHWGDNQQETKR